MIELPIESSTLPVDWHRAFLVLQARDQRAALNCCVPRMVKAERTLYSLALLAA